MRMLVLGFCFMAALFAQESKHVEAQLLSNQSQIAKNQPFLLGVKLNMRDHWHTYWENPGSSGLPTMLALEPVPGLSLGQLRFPLPKKFVDDANFITYGYDDEALLIAEATYNGDASQLVLKGKVDWLECKEVCIPGSKEVALTLPVGKATPGAERKLFEGYGGKLPLAFDDAAGFSYDAQFTFTESAWTGILKLQAKPGTKLPQTAASYQVFPLRVGEGDADLKDFQLQFKDDSVQIQLNYEPYVEKPTANHRIGVVLQLGGKDQPGYILPLYPQPNRSAALKAPGEIGTQAATQPAASAAAIQVEPAQVAAPSTSEPSASADQRGLWVFIFFAILGGIILNLMPCVLPVLSLKLFSIIEESASSPMIRIRHAWLTTAGILLSFLILSLFFVSAKLGGEQIGVGFQFQNPYFVLFMIFLIYVMALSFFGVFHLQGPNSNYLYNLTQKNGWQGPFFHGALMTLLSTPCTAPFLGPAYAWALTQSPLIIIIVFQFIGVGLALPYLALCHSPRLLAHLPKPGAWMHHLKVTMGFFLLATVVWLLNILADQTGRWGLNGTLTVMLGLGFAAYVFGRISEGARRTNFIWAFLAFAISLYFGYFRFFDIRHPKSQLLEDQAYQRLKYLDSAPADSERSILDLQQTTPERISWIPYTQGNIAYLQKQNRLIFLDFTASWCATCKANEALFVNTSAMRAAFAESQVATVKVDYTDRSDEITALLRKYNRAAVPLYVFLPGNGKAIVLPEAINQAILLKGLEEARTAMRQSSSLP